MELFSVHQFFIDGGRERVRKDVSAEEAVSAAKHYCTSVGARLGMVERVIIVDQDGHCVFEWVNDKGVTFPPMEAIH